MKKEYLYKVITDIDRIYYIRYMFLGYYVCCTNNIHSIDYSVYGGYKNIGTAARRLLMIGKANKKDTHYYYMSKKLYLLHVRNNDPYCEKHLPPELLREVC